MTRAHLSLPAKTLLAAAGVIAVSTAFLPWITGYVGVVGLSAWAAFYLLALFVLFPATDGP
jgi:hypothetical protein